MHETRDHKNVEGGLEGEARRDYMHALLRDLRALERMVKEGMFERGVSRIGSEQEMFLVDAAYHATPGVLKVLEKLDVPQYTYMRVQTTAGDEWVAVSTMSVNVGDNVTINQQLVMENFASKSLGRTFSKLVMGTASIGG
jgi:hypothetical protein